MAAVLLFWDTTMATVTSCENTLLSNGQGSLMNLVDIFFITLQEYLVDFVKELSILTFSKN